MRILTITAMGLAAIAVSGCAMTNAALKKNDEVSFTRSMNDSSAGRAIKARMRRAEGFKMSSVDVEVAQGIVVLSGHVPSPEDKIEAERIAWSAPAVYQVGNEIDVEGKQTLIRNTKDGLIKQSLRARLIAEDDVKSRNLNIEVHDGVVYLLGVARDEEELNQAAQIASTTRGVKEVVSYVKLDGEDIAGSTRTAVASRPYSGQAYGSAPGTVTTAPLSEPIPYSPQQLDPDALPDGEPYYVNPQTGERIELPKDVKPIPYTPDSPGSLGAGAIPPPGVGPGQPVMQTPTAPSQLTDLGEGMGKEFPSDDELGAYRSGNPGEAVSIIESEPYYIDPDTGQEIPVSWVQEKTK